MVNNFISNAVKYSPAGTQVIVRTTTAEGDIIVSVQDFGIGIAPENIGYLFSSKAFIKVFGIRTELFAF